ncbi:MAG: DUF2961 domain-containing protein [Verrucomicrobia bacterium]|nr:DUF2961 domain-containing protein [Verrucomicrobiota bacterium]
MRKPIVATPVLLVAFFLFHPSPPALFKAAAAEPSNKTVNVSELRTFGTVGKAVYPFTEGAKTEAVLFEHAGRGCLTHMWFGGNWPDWERQRIRVYVDGEKRASIDMELFLGHGIGFKDPAGPWGTKRIGKTGQPSGVYNTYRIPFGKSVRVTAQLHEGDTKNKRFWYIIRGVENLPVQFNGVRLPDNARLKLYKLEDYTAMPLEEFALCDIRGAGMLYQVTVAAKSERFTYLESCVRAYLDGAKEPLLLSSGLEDYFLGTYYFNRGMYHNEVAGLTHLNKDDHSFSAYRFHEEDPIFFHSGLRLTLRCGESMPPQRHNPKPQRWRAPSAAYTTYVWVYEW